LKISAVSGKIHIDNNWTDARDAGICTGNGTYSEPYIIEDLVIDGGGSGSCIWIENSDVCFKIENCTVYYSGGYDHAGIAFYNVSNALIIENNFNSSIPNYYGIYLRDSDNNSILGNIVSDTARYGIYLSDSDNNTLSGNTANYNKDNGIFLRDSDNNTISGNTANYNSNWYGIYLYNSDNNKILGNTANYNKIGIYFVYGHNNTISGNIMNQCGLLISGDLEMLTSYIIDTTNLVNGKPLYYYLNETNLGPNNFTNAGELILVNCTDSLISNLDTSYCYNGISLYYCNNNIISRNIANHHLGRGINLRNSDNNIISENTANNNFCGIGLSYSNNNTISGNIVWNSPFGGFGITTIGSNNNTISGNTVSDNYFGVYLDESNNTHITGNNANNNNVRGISVNGNNNTISGNTANYNQIGIYLVYNNNNNVSGNTANYNQMGIYLEGSDYNDITRNTANYNQIGIYLVYSDNNDITRNTANYNQIGIYLVYSDNNDITGNPLIGNDECIVEGNCQGNEFSDNGFCTYGQSKDGEGFPIELIILISSISGGSVIGVAILLFIRHKRERIP